MSHECHPFIQNLLVGQRESSDNEDEERGQDSSEEDSTDSDSEDDLLHPKDLQLPGIAMAGRQRNLIQVVSEHKEEEERSDGEMTVASSGSGER